MARTAKLRPARPPNVDPPEEMVETVAIINKILAGNSIDVEVANVVTTSVIEDFHGDGKPIYKSARINVGQPLKLSNVWVGSTGWVFRMEPLDGQPYKFAEFKMKDVFAVFPTLERTIVGALKEIVDEEDVTTFAQVASRIKRLAKEGIAETKKVATEVAYKDNPKFGIF